MVVVSHILRPSFCVLETALLPHFKFPHSKSTALPREGLHDRTHKPNPDGLVRPSSGARSARSVLL